MFNRSPIRTRTVVNFPFELVALQPASVYSTARVSLSWTPTLPVVTRRLETSTEQLVNGAGEMVVRLLMTLAKTAASFTDNATAVKIKRATHP